jgi:hypothetical protein
MISHESTTDSWLRGMKLRGQCFHCLKHPLIPLCLFEMVTNIHWSSYPWMSSNIFQLDLWIIWDQRGTRRLAPQGVFRHKSGPSRRYPHKKKHISTWQQILALSPWCHHDVTIQVRSVCPVVQAPITALKASPNMVSCWRHVPNHINHTWKWRCEIMWPWFCLRGQMIVFIPPHPSSSLPTCSDDI